MTRLHLQPCRNWVATSLTRPFTVRYIPFSQTLEVLDTYSSTNNLITVRTNNTFGFTSNVQYCY